MGHPCMDLISYLERDLPSFCLVVSTRTQFPTAPWADERHELYLMKIPFLRMIHMLLLQVLPLICEDPFSSSRAVRRFRPSWQILPAPRYI